MAKKNTPLTPEQRLQEALVPRSQWPYKIPANWCWCKIGNLVNLLRGVSYKKNDAHKINNKTDCLILRGGNILEGSLDLENDNIYVDRKLVGKEQLVKKGDIIVVSSTGSKKVIGRAGVSNADFDNVAFGAFLTLVRPNRKANISFIDYYFQNEIYRERIRKLASDVNINNIRSEHITDTPIPLPPLPEQQRIVNRIESLFSKLHEAKEKTQTVLDSFETRKAAILHQAFIGKLTAKWRKEHNIGMDSWKKFKLEELGKLERGRSKHRPRNDPKLFGGIYPFIQTGDIANARMYITQHKQNLSDLGKAQSKLFSKGTLCITIAANIGKVAILSYDCCFPDSVVGFTPNKLTNSEFIYYLMGTLQKELEANAP